LFIYYIYIYVFILQKINVLYTIQLELAIEKAFSYNGTSQISHLNINGYYNDPRDRNILPIEKL